MRPVKVKRAEDVGEAWQKLRLARGLRVSRGRGTLRLGATGPVTFDVAAAGHALFSLAGNG